MAQFLAKTLLEKVKGICRRRKPTLAESNYLFAQDNICTAAAADRLRIAFPIGSSRRRHHQLLLLLQLAPASLPRLDRSSHNPLDHCFLNVSKKGKVSGLVLAPN
jgi:hypothetical protein